MSKIPPQLFEPGGMARECASAVGLSHGSKYLAAAGKYFVQRILEVRGRLRQLGADLRLVVIVALLDLVAESVLERPGSPGLGVLVRIVGDYIRHKGAR